MFASALLRRVSSSGGFGAVIRRGHQQAGAIFIMERRRDGEIILFGPAPQMVYDEKKPDERFFQELMRSGDAAEVDARMEKEQRFDPDIWLLEIEPGSLPLEQLITMVERI